MPPSTRANPRRDSSSRPLQPEQRPIVLPRERPLQPPAEFRLRELAAFDPSVLADTEARFVDDGDVVTSAGVSAGIDMALHLVARLDSPEAARGVRRGIQYDPAPPV